ncbi:tRNA 2'-phosphotransferase 1, partial [Symbiodinium microadriaticum]
MSDPFAGPKRSPNRRHRCAPSSLRSDGGISADVVRAAQADEARTSFGGGYFKRWLDYSAGGPDMAQPKPASGSNKSLRLFNPFNIDREVATTLTAAEAGVDANDPQAVQAYLGGAVTTRKDVFDIVRNYHTGVIRSELYNLITQMECVVKNLDDRILRNTTELHWLSSESRTEQKRSCGLQVLLTGWDPTMTPEERHFMVSWMLQQAGFIRTWLERRGYSDLSAEQVFLNVLQESAPVAARWAASALSEAPSLRPVAPSSGHSSAEVPFAEAWRLIQRGEPAEEVAQHCREGTMLEAYADHFSPAPIPTTPASTPAEASERAFRALLRPPSGEPAPQARARIIDVDVHGDGVYISLFIRFARELEARAKKKAQRAQEEAQVAAAAPLEEAEHGAGAGDVWPEGPADAEEEEVEIEVEMEEAAEAEAEGLHLRPDGYFCLDDLVQTREMRLQRAQPAELIYVVRQDEKQRYTLRYFGGAPYLRAAQGHSQYVSKEHLMQRMRCRDLPPYLYHGTRARNYESIVRRGILAGGPSGCRTDIHLVEHLPNSGQRVLSGWRSNCELAIQVAPQAADSGECTSYCSDNGVYLTEGVRGAISPQFSPLWLSSEPERSLPLLQQARPPQGKPLQPDSAERVEDKWAQVAAGAFVWQTRFPTPAEVLMIAMPRYQAAHEAQHAQLVRSPCATCTLRSDATTGQEDSGDADTLTATPGSCIAPIRDDNDDYPFEGRTPAALQAGWLKTADAAELAKRAARAAAARGGAGPAAGAAAGQAAIAADAAGDQAAALIPSHRPPKEGLLAEDEPRPPPPPKRPAAALEEAEH